MTDYAYILAKKYAGKQWILDGETYSGLKWLDKTISKPTKKTLDAEYLEYKRLTDYVKLRAEAYPSIGDQLDAVLKGFNQLRFNGTDLPADLDAVIGQWLAVKAQYPKPDGE